MQCFAPPDLIVFGLFSMVVTVLVLVPILVERPWRKRKD